MTKDEEIEELIEQNELFRGQLEQAALILDQCDHCFAAGKIRHLIYEKYPSRRAQTPSPSRELVFMHPPVDDWKQPFRDHTRLLTERNKKYNLHKHRLEEERRRSEEQPRDVGSDFVEAPNFQIQAQNTLGWGKDTETIIEVDESCFIGVDPGTHDRTVVHELTEIPDKSEEDIK